MCRAGQTGVHRQTWPFPTQTFSQLQNLLSVAHEKVKPGEDFSSATASLKGVFMASDFGSPGSALAVADMDDWNDDEKN